MVDLQQKIESLEARCPGCSFKVEGEGDEAIIRISEFGRLFIVRKEWAALEGDWPECWFDFELARRPVDVEEAVEQAKNRIAMVGAGHDYGCRCGVCQEWWKLMGPDPDTGQCGPWTMEELGLNPADWEA